MIIDLVILLPWVGFGVLGFRDASVRKLTAIVVSIIALFVGQLLMHDVGNLFKSQLHVQPADAPMLAFLAIFFFMFFLQSILYRFLTGNYKIGGIVDRICGVVLGLVEGAVVISIIIFILTMQGPPSRRTLWDSRLYHPTASIAPRIMDFFSSMVSTANESVKDLTSPGSKELDSLRRDGVDKPTSPGEQKPDSTLPEQRR
jgi:uncharacterized membrane protein required for colicin V production